MHRVAAVLVAIALSTGAAACGDDEEAPSGSTGAEPTTSAATETTATESAPTETEPAEPTADDEPFAVEATIDAIEQVGGSDDPADMDAGITIVTAKATDGKSYRVLIPPDVTLDETAARVLRDPACAGKVLANLELVPAPPSEDQGDHVLVTANIDTESC